MATALAQGFIRAGLVTRERVVASDVDAASREHFGRATGANVVAFNPEVVTACDTVIVAVKPAQVAGVLHEVSGSVGPDHLVVSIAAVLPWLAWSRRCRRARAW